MGNITGVGSPTLPSSATNKSSLTNLGVYNPITLPIGCIFPFVSDSIPNVMLLCNGQAVNTYTYSILHSVISNKYGGTAYQVGVTDQPGATTTFNLPNFQVGNKIPIGKDSSASGINTLGASGGSFSHNHAGADHTHYFTHTHTVSSHNHTYSHSHTMGNHTHSTYHTHRLPQHKHIIYAHGHAAHNISYYWPTDNSMGTPKYGSDHYHTMTGTYANAAGNSNDGRPSSKEWPNGNQYYNTSQTATSFATGGSIGSGTDMSLYDIWSGDTLDWCSYADPGSSAPTNNSTSTFSGSLDSTSFSLNSYTGNTSAAGSTISTTIASEYVPPFVTVNFVIKALPDEQIVNAGVI